MPTTPEQLFILSDNTIEYANMVDKSDGTYINDATVTVTLYRQVAVDAVMTASSTTLSSAAAPFLSGDASKKILVMGAGEDGSDLWTTVSTFTSSTALVLAAASTNAVSEEVAWISVTNALTVTMAYVAASNGKYRGTIDDSVPLKDRENYMAVISVDAGSDLKDFRIIDSKAIYRRSA